MAPSAVGRNSDTVLPTAPQLAAFGRKRPPARAELVRPVRSLRELNAEGRRTAPKASVFARVAEMQRKFLQFSPKIRGAQSVAAPYIPASCRRYGVGTGDVLCRTSGRRMHNAGKSRRNKSQGFAFRSASDLRYVDAIVPGAGFSPYSRRFSPAFSRTSGGIGGARICRADGATDAFRVVGVFGTESHVGAFGAKRLPRHPFVAER